MNAQERKERPVYSGVLMYFPDALLEVARASFVGNEQHNPGQPLHWNRAKSTDEADACVRHLLEAGKIDTDGIRHSAKAAWRALALLQKEIEAEQAPVPQSESEVGWRVKNVFDGRKGTIIAVEGPYAGVKWFTVQWDNNMGTAKGWTWAPENGSLERIDA